MNGSYYLDTALMMKTRDSIILLYRPNAGADWKEFPKYTKSYLGGNYGYVTLDSVPLGQYTFANGVSTVLGINEQKNPNASIMVYPNPTSDNFTIAVNAMQVKQYVSIYTIEGKLVTQVTIAPGQKTCVIETNKWANGVYNASLSNGTKQIATTKIVIAH